MNAEAFMPIATDPRFLLIKAWGCGFWSDMNHVLGCLLLAEITGRVPVTHWGRNSLYRDASGSDAFRVYFEPVSPFSIGDIEALCEASFFPPKWTADSLRHENYAAKFKGPYSRLTGSFYLDRPETVAVSDFYIHVPDLITFIPTTHDWHGKSYAELYRLLSQKFLRPAPHIFASVDAFQRNHMLGPRPTIAVHIRGTDKFNEAKNAPGIETYFDIIDREAPDWRIFLLTDQAQFVEAFTQRYGARVIFTDAQRSNSLIAPHHLRSADRTQLGVDIVVDTYLALRCQKFVGLGMSNPSCIISVLKPWGEGDCTLLGPNLLEMNFAARIGRDSANTAI